MNPVVRGDIVVSHFLDSVGGYRCKERRDRLLDILDVDLDWHMHTISDGERRRVQLVMGLMTQWDVLLLDEVYITSTSLSVMNYLLILKLCRLPWILMYRCEMTYSAFLKWIAKHGGSPSSVGHSVYHDPPSVVDV